MVREPDSIGRDVVDDLHAMAGFARLMEPDSIDVLEDGRNGGAAVVRGRSWRAVALVDWSAGKPRSGASSLFNSPRTTFWNRVRTC